MTQFTEYASVGREMAALVLFSGGQDSTTCLGWALERFGRVETIGVDYGQRHQAELECRVRVREKWRSLSRNGENDSEMIISSSFRCWGKLPIVRSQMSAALLLKRQVCLIRSSLGEISSFYACRFARISTGASGARGRYV